MRVLSVMLAVCVVIMTASGVASTISGSGPGPALLGGSGVLTAFYLLNWALTFWQTRSQAELLVFKLSEILGSTATIEP